MNKLNLKYTMSTTGEIIEEWKKSSGTPLIIFQVAILLALLLDLFLIFINPNTLLATTPIGYSLAVFLAFVFILFFVGNIKRYEYWMKYRVKDFEMGNRFFYFIAVNGFYQHPISNFIDSQVQIFYRENKKDNKKRYYNPSFTEITAGKYKKYLGAFRFRLCITLKREGKQEAITFVFDDDKISEKKVIDVMDHIYEKYNEYMSGERKVERIRVLEKLKGGG